MYGDTKGGMNGMKRDERYIARLLAVLSRHVGKARAISMVELYRFVFEEEPKDKISGTRRLRQLITRLRKEGVPVCSSTETNGGGYYLASTGTDLEVYCKKLRRRALRALAMEAKLRNTTLPELIGQIQLNLTREVA